MVGGWGELRGECSLSNVDDPGVLSLLYLDFFWHLL